MAGPEDFFSPGEWIDPTQLAVPPQVQQAFENPHLRAAATQFGLNMLAGGGWGGGFGQDLARGIGGAGEAVGRGEAMDTTQRGLDIRQQEAGSRAEARTAQAEAATSRAQTAQGALQLAQEKAAANAQLAQAKVEQNQQRIDGLLRLQDQKISQATSESERKRLRDEREGIVREGKLAEDRIRTQAKLDAADETRKKNRTGQVLAIQGLYQRSPEVAAAIKANSDPLNSNKPKQPIPSFNDWLQKNQHLWSSDLFPDIPRTSAEPTTPGAAATPSTTPTAAAPPAPRNPAERKAGQSYMTPKGVLTWDGAAWQTP